MATHKVPRLGKAHGHYRDYNIRLSVGLTCCQMSSQRSRISDVHLGSAIQLLSVKMSCPDLSEVRKTESMCNISP